MRGVAVDCTNWPPVPLKLHNAGLDSIRIEMRDLPLFYDYTKRVANYRKGIDQAWLVGPQTGSLVPILANTTVQPSLCIIGNEPDQEGESSWGISPATYISLWDEAAHLLRAKWPNIELATAGMNRPAYLRSVYPYLNPKPTYVNLHYPSGIDEIQEFSSGRPIIIGEWCWRTATYKEMLDWETMLEYYTWHSFWFCWGDWMIPDMGLKTTTDRPTRAYYNLKRAIKEIHGS